MRKTSPLLRDKSDQELMEGLNNTSLRSLRRHLMVGTAVVLQGVALLELPPSPGRSPGDPKIVQPSLRAGRG
jgi:hypothetical protein